MEYPMAVKPPKPSRVARNSRKQEQRKQPPWPFPVHQPFVPQAR